MGVQKPCMYLIRGSQNLKQVNLNIEPVMSSLRLANIRVALVREMIFLVSEFT